MMIQNLDSAKSNNPAPLLQVKDIHTTFNIKQKGALLAKGRVLGIQFLELFKENLYFELL